MIPKTFDDGDTFTFTLEERWAMLCELMEVDRLLTRADHDDEADPDDDRRAALMALGRAAFTLRSKFPDKHIAANT